MSTNRSFLVFRSGSLCADPTQEEALAELERVADLLDGRDEDPGALKSISERVKAVITALDEWHADGDVIAEHIEAFMSKEIDPIKDLINGEPGDPGHLYDAKDRTIAVFKELKNRLAKATLTLDAIGRAEGV